MNFVRRSIWNPIRNFHSRVRQRFTPRRMLLFLVWIILIVALPMAMAQRSRRGRQVRFDRQGVPEWTIESRFKHDVFTFVRIKYTSSRYGWGYDKWTIDYPDSDLNFSFRLQQLTSLKVDPNGKILELTDPELFNHPFIYVIEPGDMVLADEEVASLRKYLLNGGFMMVDDFWGEREWRNFYEQIKRVFPEREPTELPVTHPIFSAVFPLKEKPQVPAVGYIWNYLQFGIAYERPDAEEVHYKALFDDKGRMMAIICHNTDLGDGWEREGENEDYFREFSEKKAYPMGINIVFYAMTH